MKKTTKIAGNEKKEKNASPLTPDLKSFIDVAIVPILVKEFLKQETTRSKEHTVSSHHLGPGELKPKK
jgi:hypothetical protein